VRFDPSKNADWLASARISRVVANDCDPRTVVPVDACERLLGAPIATEVQKQFYKFVYTTTDRDSEIYLELVFEVQSSDHLDSTLMHVS
jgi:hypothetical protein